jgi:hypothetical protein
MQLGGKLYVTDTTDSTTTSNGSIIISGGLGLAKNLRMGGNLFVSSSAFFTQYALFYDIIYVGDTGSFVQNFGSGLRLYSATSGYMQAGGTTVLNYTSSVVSVPITTNSTSAAGTNGALCTSGGVSIAKDLWVQGNAYLGSSYPFNYAEGTFTPGIVFAGTGVYGTITTSSAVGNVRIWGTMVSVTITIVWTFTATTAQKYSITNLPYTPNNGSRAAAVITKNNRTLDVNYSYGLDPFFAEGTPGASTLDIWGVNLGSYLYLTPAVLGSTGPNKLAFDMTYHI